MITLGVDLQENEFYAPYTEECWINLAKAIMEVYAIKYSCLLPTTAYTQMEYDHLTRQTFAPMRRSVLKSIKHGPLRHVVDIQGAYAGLEKARIDYKNRLRIRWEDTYTIDLNNL